MSLRFLAAAALVATLPAHADVVLANGVAYSQNFDSLASSGTTNTFALNGWSLFTKAGAAVTTYEAGPGSNTAGKIYSFGSTNSSDRALGSLGSGSFEGFIAASFTNSSGSAFNSFTLAFDGEQWRNGGNATAQTMMLQYGFGSSFGTVGTWNTPGGSFDFVSPIHTNTAAALDGNAAANRAAGLGGTIDGLSWDSGQTLWVRWVEVNDTGNDHALAIDNFSITAVSAVPEPSGMALVLAGLLAVATASRRKRG